MANLFKEKLESTSFQKSVGFLVNQIYLFLSFPFCCFFLPFFSKDEKQLVTWARLIPEITFIEKGV